VTAYFLGNGNAQFSATNVPTPAPGQWQKVPLSFTPAGYQIGQTINFLLFASTSQGYQQVNFDIDIPISFYCSPPLTLINPASYESFQIIYNQGPIISGRESNVTTGEILWDFNLTPAYATMPTFNLIIQNPSSTFPFAPQIIYTDALGLITTSPSCTATVNP
jgi:hypothetical protein